MLLTFTKPEFENLIKDGTKKHTIRADKHNRWKDGAFLKNKADMDLQKLRDWFDSDEGQKSIADFADKVNREEEIKTKQLERFNRLGNFEQFTKKVIEKYNSDKYRDRWYNREIEPPEDLFWFLFHYAEKYGRECNEEEWKLYGNMFSSALFFCNGYYFNRMDGQGSVIHVTKQGCSNGA